MVYVADGISLEEVLIPVICFLVCGCFQAWEFLRKDDVAKARARTLFKSVRSGWVTDNYMKGQAAVNTTRDYIRAAVFFANTAILLTTFSVGFTGSTYSDCLDNGCSNREWLLIIKLGVLAAIFLVIFFVFTQCTRFAVHFSFCINTRELDGVPMPHSLIVKVFNHSHHYYSLGIRLYFGTIPVFAWIFASWALLVITPVYIYMVRGLEDARFVEDEIAEVAKLQAELQGASRIANTVAGADSADRRAVSTAATVGSSATNVSSSVVSGSKQHVV